MLTRINQASLFIRVRPSPGVAMKKRKGKKKEGKQAAAALISVMRPPSLRDN